MNPKVRAVKSRWSPDADLNIGLYKSLYLIRRTEEKILEHYGEDGMKTPMHMSMGGEAIAVGVCRSLQPKDQVFATYRSHAAFLAKTGDVGCFFAEMYAKETSPMKGRCGSMHLCSPADGFMGASAIVASHIPVAVGCAFANKVKRSAGVVAVFFGDGAVDEGGFWESLNIACLMKLPVLFVCEDNGLAVHTPSSQRRGYESLVKIVSAFDCRVVQSSSTDAEAIYRLSVQAVKSVRREHRPCFMNLKYYRYLEHVGINKDFDAGYRSKKEFDLWFRKDPVSLQRAKLARAGVSGTKIKKIEDQVEQEVLSALSKAKEAALSHQYGSPEGVL